MAYRDPKNDRPYAREYILQKRRGEGPARKKREQARDLYDKKGINRKGMDIDHATPLSKGGSNSPSNLRLRKPSQNRSFSRNSDRSVKRNVPKS